MVSDSGTVSGSSEALSSFGALVSAVQDLVQLQALVNHRRNTDALVSSAENLARALEEATKAITSWTHGLQETLIEETERAIDGTLADRRWTSQWLKHITGRISTSERLVLQMADPIKCITEDVSSLSLSSGLGSNGTLELADDIRMLEVKFANASQRYKEAKIGCRDLWEALNSMMDELTNGCKY